MIRLVCIALLVSGTLAAAGLRQIAPELTDRVHAILVETYKLNHARARELCRSLRRDYPNDPAADAFLARVIWSEELKLRRALSIDRYIASDYFADDARYRVPIPAETQVAFDEATQSAIAKAKAILDRKPNDAWATYILGIAYQNDASFHASLRHNWWASVRHGSKAYKYHKELLEQHPDLADARLVTGVYSYVAGSLPWRVRWLSALLGYHGNRTEGLRDIERAARDSHLAADDALTMLGFLYAKERRFEDARSLFVQLHRRYPEHSLLHLDIGKLSLRMNRWPEALVTFREVLAKIEANSPGYEVLDRAAVYNQLGMATRAGGDLAGAEQWFGKSLSDSQGPEGLRAIAHLEMGKTLELMGRRTDALQHYRAVQSLQVSSELQRQARDLAASPFKAPKRASGKTSADVSARR